jgi:hypothetical protein
MSRSLAARWNDANGPKPTKTGSKSRSAASPSGPPMQFSPLKREKGNVKAGYARISRRGRLIENI